MATHFETRAQILAELWVNYRNDQNFEEFFEYNDIGLPLAYAIYDGIVESTEMAEKFVNETFELLLDGLDLEDNPGYENIDELLEEADI